MTDRELMQMALDALDCIYSPLHVREINKVGGAIEALRARLAQPEPEPYPENFIDALRYHTAINEQPEQEPVAWHEPGAYSNVTAHEKWAKENGWLPLYTAPPQREEGCAECGKKASEGWALYCVKCSEPVREWQGLTDEEAEQIVDEHWEDLLMLMEAIEAKLKEKNT